MDYERLIRKENIFLNRKIINIQKKENFDNSEKFAEDPEILNNILRMKLSVILRFKIKQRYISRDRNNIDYRKYSNDCWLINEFKKLNDESASPSEYLNKLKNVKNNNLGDQEIVNYMTAIDYKDALAKVILDCVELNTERAEGKSTLLTESNIELEHIYPRRYNKNNKLYMCLPDNLWFLGNLSLLERKINEKISNDDFDIKNEYYCKSKMIVTRQICCPDAQWNRDSIDKWTDEKIKCRGKILAEEFVKF